MEQPPKLLEAGGIGLLVSVAVGITTLLAAWLTYLVLSLLPQSGGPEAYLAPLAGVILAAIIAGQLYLQGRLTEKLYRKRGYPYRSAWNLAAAYPIAGALTGGLIGLLGIWSLFLGYGFRLPQDTSLVGGVLIAGTALLAYTAALGLSLNWVNSWSENTGKIVTLAIGVAAWIAATLTVCAVIIGINLVRGLLGEKSNQNHNSIAKASLQTTLGEIRQELKPGYYLAEEPFGKLSQCASKKAASRPQGCKPLKLQNPTRMQIAVDSYWPQQGAPAADQTVSQTLIRDPRYPACIATLNQSASGKITGQQVDCD